MTLLMNATDRWQFEVAMFDTERFERFRYTRNGECPVRSHASRTRGRMRSRATAAYSRKMRTINGAHRRGRSMHVGPVF